MATDYTITKITVNGFQDGEQITESVLNRPINNLENNIDNLLAMVNSEDPLTQYTTDDRATVIAENQSILFTIALG